jgi:branched-chain amino acid transport system permease protein
MVICAAFSALLGVFMTFLDTRFRLGHLSFALITLAFAEIGILVFSGSDFLGGDSGLFLSKDQGRFLQFEFGGSKGYFWAALFMVSVAYLMNHGILLTKLGYRLRTIRDNEQAAEVIGVELFKTKATALALSAAVSSMVGTLFARFLTFVDPHLLASPTLSIEVVLVATIGGLGTPLGPVVAGLILIPLGEYLRAQFGGVLPGLHLLDFGVFVVGIVMLSPSGLVPALVSLFDRLRRRKA